MKCDGITGCHRRADHIGGGAPGAPEGPRGDRPPEGGPGGALGAAERPVGQLPIFGRISAKFRSFSAVSKRNFANKYAFDSIFRNLPDYLAKFFEIWKTIANFSTFAKKMQNFHQNC